MESTEETKKACQHPQSKRLQIAWYQQYCEECGEVIPVDIPAYPKDEERGRRLMRQNA